MCRIYFLFVVFTSGIFITNLKAQDTTYCIFDEPCSNSLPPNYRSANDPFHRSTDLIPDTSGIGFLNASGSAEFCDLNLPTIIKSIDRKNITIVDLRQESHGFVNGLPVSWYGKYDWGNVGLTRKEVEANEKHRLDSLLNTKNIVVTKILEKDKATNALVKTEAVPLKVKTVQTEKELTEEFNLGYFRITATDHRQPTVEDVDRFINFINGLDKNMWLHFHCHAGDGRTTTFLAMYDMVRNSKTVSLQDILRRQYLLGGINLASDDDFPEWDKQYAIGRTEFMKDFYDYCRTNTDNFKTLYSEWLKNK